ncbi:hypothetical protein [Embleya sp. NBC_00896]|uniref:hypothetical protein n=1 Tax=Embleya sp. NBC_00896 TaxID=2975961 RepID=UPI003867FAF1|nr:hypothetical protein OG928_15785 [Embleya sp. NBC_00896]
MHCRPMLLVAAIATALALGGCGDDDDSAPSVRAPSITAPATVANCAEPGLTQDQWLRLCGPASGNTRAPGRSYSAPVGGWVQMPGDIVLSVSRVEATPIEGTGGPGSTPCVVTLTVTNRSSAPYDVSGIVIREMSGTSGGGRAERITHSQLDHQELTGLIAPGTSTFTNQLFNVPNEILEGFRVVVGLQPTPGTVPDATFTGALIPSATPTTATSTP